jgi:flagellar biogenesis protein FliO
MIVWLHDHLIELLGGMFAAMALILLIRWGVWRFAPKAVKGKTQVSFTD